jgi:hypothetical protein
MFLPYVSRAIVPRAKVRDYLLCLAHPVGRFKAAFFRDLGFRPERWGELAGALIRHAADNRVEKVERSGFGTRYIVEGALDTPVGRRPVVRTVWFLDPGSSAPRIVTAYPHRWSSDHE